MKSKCLKDLLILWWFIIYLISSDDLMFYLVFLSTNNNEIKWNYFKGGQQMMFTKYLSIYISIKKVFYDLSHLNQ